MLKINYGYKVFVDRLVINFIKEKEGKMLPSFAKEEFLNVKKIFFTHKNLKEIKSLLTEKKEGGQELEKKLFSYIENIISKKDFEIRNGKNFIFTKNIIENFETEDIVKAMGNFYGTKVKNVAVYLIPTYSDRKNVGASASSRTNSIYVYVLNKKSKGYIENLKINLVHELAHLYERDHVLEKIKTVFKPREENFYKSWFLLKKEFGNGYYITREILANLFSNWDFSYLGEKENIYNLQKYNPKKYRDKEELLIGKFNQKNNHNFHRVYYLYSFYCKDFFWEYINNKKKVDEDFFIKIADVLTKK
ncbi:MAG: hypothetical protein WC724_01250 [Candidatus Paceibacterota bacterium]|jgi:hypothetical protein